QAHGGPRGPRGRAERLSQLRDVGQGDGGGGRRELGGRCPPPPTRMVILGVDPGSLRTGYGAIDTDGRRHRLIEKGFIAPPSRGSLPERLRLIHAGVGELIVRLRPEVLAVEDVFHAVNTRTALVLGHVRGVVLLAG